MVRSPIATGKELGKKEIILGILYSPSIILRSLKLKALGLYFFVFKPKLLRMLSGLARKTSLLHVSVLKSFLTAFRLNSYLS